MRYWLKIPMWKKRQAIHAGCQYDLDRKQWYVDEPLKPGFILDDFSHWTPSKEAGHITPGSAS